MNYASNLEDQIFLPGKFRSKPMNVAVFVSGGGGNLQAAISLSKKYPGLVKIRLVISDRFKIKALEIAKRNKIPFIVKNFDLICGRWAKAKRNAKKSALYNKCTQGLHDEILQEILAFEVRNNLKIELIVLSYHRWVHGRLLKHFARRIINQHAGDLTIMKEGNLKKRKYIGINPVYDALRSGEPHTRTSTFLVRYGKDSGEILCRGPIVKYEGPKPVTRQSSWAHEVRQKRLSDWPSLQFAIYSLARGYFSLSRKKLHPDDNRLIYYQGWPMPYGGINLDQLHQYKYDSPY